MGNCVTDVVSGLSAILEKLSPCCKGAEREARRIQRSGLGVQGQGASADWAVMPKGTKWEPATQGWQGLALAVGTARGQPLPPSPGACPRACGKAFLRSLVICHLSCLLLCLQEGAKEFAAMHNPRSKCSGRRRRRHHVVSASCSNTPAVTETREGDSDRDTGNEWASSSSGMVPVLRHPTPLCEGRQLLAAGILPGSPLLPAQLENLELAVSVPSKSEGHQPCPCCYGIHCLLPGMRNVAWQSKSFAGTCKDQSEPLAPERCAWPEAEVCGWEGSARLQGTRG